jgi:hypothetical protein
MKELKCEKGEIMKHESIKQDEKRSRNSENCWNVATEFVRLTSMRNSLCMYFLLHLMHDCLKHDI